MKRIKIIGVLAAAILLAGCGSAPKQAGISDFSGTWKQTGDNDSYQEAVIADGTIEIYWMSTDTKSLYWAGTFENPDKEVTEYTVISENDHDKTDMAMLASGADTKEITYKDGTLNYDVSAMGTTKTVHLEPEKTE